LRSVLQPNVQSEREVIEAGYLGIDIPLGAADCPEEFGDLTSVEKDAVALWARFNRDAVEYRSCKLRVLAARAAERGGLANPQVSF
jgi:hypothetical protein